MPEDVKGAVKEALAEAEASKPKPGIKTSECWITLALLLIAGLAQAGVFDTLAQSDNKWVKLAGMIGAALAVMKYTGSRTSAKNGNGK